MLHGAEIGQIPQTKLSCGICDVNHAVPNSTNYTVDLLCFQKGASYSGIRIFNSLPRSITYLKNEKTQFKVALKKFLNAHSFYSVDELFTCTDDIYCWLYECVNVSYTVIFLLFVCLWHVPHPIVLWLWRIYGMYICMFVCFPVFSFTDTLSLTLNCTSTGVQEFCPQTIF
jgi:uncharacterized membrane protein